MALVPTRSLGWARPACTIRDGLVVRDQVVENDFGVTTAAPFLFVAANTVQKIEGIRRRPSPKEQG